MFTFAIGLSILKLCPTRNRDYDMKKLLFSLVISVVLTSCSQSLYYQMYQTKPITENIEVNENALKFEDDNCVILYDFWGENGDMGFVIHNKTDQNLYLHLDECFYVENGFAYDYIDTNNNSSIIVGNNAKIEKKAICIPPKYSKKISEYTINGNLYRDCDLFLYPVKNDNNTLDFTQENSPFIFGNKLAYSIGDSDTINQINNIFYVSKISNYAIEDITKLIDKQHCGEKLGVKKRVLIEHGPDQFYIKYEWEPDNDYLRH